MRTPPAAYLCARDKFIYILTLPLSHPPSCNLRSLDAEWVGPLCDPAVQGCSAMEADCPFIASYQNITSAVACQNLCVQSDNCTAINYAPLPSSASYGVCELRACNDLPPATDPDNDGFTVYSYLRGIYTTISLDDGAYTRKPLVAKPCPTEPSPLSPRDTGYAVGVAHLTSGNDRLLVLGGDSLENNVYYSDDCGATWSCYDGSPNDDPDLDWDARAFSPIIHPIGLFPDDPVIMMGGLVLEQVPSIGWFITTDVGPDMCVRRSGLLIGCRARSRPAPPPLPMLSLFYPTAQGRQ